MSIQGDYRGTRLLVNKDEKTTVGTKIFRGKMLCASEIILYLPVVTRVKDYTRENTRQLLYNVNMYVLYTHKLYEFYQMFILSLA